jgi:hypothetical protein
MKKNKFTEEDFIDVLKHGLQWHSEKIKDEIEKILILYSNNHKLVFNNRDKHYYIDDDGCCLFIFDGKIELRSDRENVPSEGKTFTYKINGAGDILSAYEYFEALTNEDEFE